MITRTITYEDYNGTTRTEEFRFGLLKSELAKLELKTTGGMQAHLQRMIDAQDNEEIMKTFEKLILMSYGEKSVDGKRFVKNEEIAEAFSQTPAYDQLFMELITDEKKAAEFISGIMPADIQKELQKENLLTQTMNS